MADPLTLAQYDQVEPGTARAILEAFLRTEAVQADAVERESIADARATTADARATIVDAVGAQVLTVGGLVVAVALIMAGHTYGMIGIVPAIIASSAQVIAAQRRRRDDSNN